MKQTDLLKEKLFFFINKEGYFPTVRQFMDFVGYKSTRSVSVFFDKLQSEGILRKVAPHKYELYNIHDDAVLFKRYIDSLSIEVLNKYIEYLNQRINLKICEKNLVSFVEENIQTQCQNVAHLNVNEHIEQI